MERYYHPVQPPDPPAANGGPPAAVVTAPAPGVAEDAFAADLVAAELDWTDFVTHPAAPKLVHRVRRHDPVSAPRQSKASSSASSRRAGTQRSHRSAPPSSAAAGTSSASRRTHAGVGDVDALATSLASARLDAAAVGQADAIDPALDMTSPSFDPARALATPTASLPPDFFPVRKFPLFDNLAQFTSLVWNPSSSSSPSTAPPPTPAAGPSSYSMDLAWLAASAASADSPTAAVRAWHVWLRHAHRVHVGWHTDRLRRITARAEAAAADRDTAAREARKVAVLKAREAALALGRAVEYWDWAGREFPDWAAAQPNNPAQIAAHAETLDAWTAEAAAAAAAAATASAQKKAAVAIPWSRRARVSRTGVKS
ncbi:hypothetical protein H9P43_007506 [Blastocladiella emersonii ATCC 22665]|nr:hypothetical protein H9P43_007506 [Blastocladiella emersonii ATCC 22665]